MLPEDDESCRPMALVGPQIPIPAALEYPYGKCTNRFVEKDLPAQIPMN